MSSKRLKTKALSQLNNNWYEVIAAITAATLIPAAVSAAVVFLSNILSMIYGMFDAAILLPPFFVAMIALSVVSYLVYGIAEYGKYTYTLGFVRSGVKDLSALVSGFKSLQKCILLYIIKYIFIFLWTLLFIIPGIVAMYRYSAATFILIENPEMSPMEALRASSELMKGHKGERFVLDLSFLGWSILSALSVYGFILLNPYYETAAANFYVELADNRPADQYGAAV